MSATYIAPVWAWRARDLRLAALTGQAGTCVRAGTAVTVDYYGNMATLVNNQPRFVSITTIAGPVNETLVYQGGAALPDYLAWTVPIIPVPLTFYVKLINQGAPASSLSVMGLGIWDAPSLYLIKTSANAYSFCYASGLGIGESDSASVATTGQTIELRCVLRSTGTIQIYTSTNGGAEVAGAASAGGVAIVAGWGDTNLALGNSVHTPNSSDDKIFAAGMWLGEQSLASCQAML